MIDADVTEQDDKIARTQGAESRAAGHTLSTGHETPSSPCHCQSLVASRDP
jgi:hypothetical protein